MKTTTRTAAAANRETVVDAELYNFVRGAPNPPQEWLQAECEPLTLPGRDPFAAELLLPKTYENELALNEGAFCIPYDQEPIELRDSIYFYRYSH